MYLSCSMAKEDWNFVVFGLYVCFVSPKGRHTISLELSSGDYSMHTESLILQVLPKAGVTKI